MSERKPRLPPLPESEWTDEVRDALGHRLGAGRALNIFTTLARHPALLKRWLVFGSHILGGSTLSPRAREMLILRTGYRCKSEYEWGQHAQIGKMCGLTDDELRRIIAGPNAPGWDPVEALLLRAADELHDDQVVSDGTWAGLREHLDEKQLLDLVFTVGQYTLVSMALNTLGVQLDAGVEGFPK
ncbi:MAG TPA: carboxymuconolactone decarboxylase family protein [Polyangiaceae bacterium]|nr:carboxymuconolactone decarboxylase family protein [Polyangiaceae bacterium]